MGLAFLWQMGYKGPIIHKIGVPLSLYDQCQTYNPTDLMNPIKTTYQETNGVLGQTRTIHIPGVVNDVINSPNHYARGKFEVWDIIEFFKLNYNLGNVCKYILRAGVKTKNPLEDYKKARAYLDREIAILEGKLDVRPS